MYFHYPSENILPHGLQENIEETKVRIVKVDAELKFGINEFFNDIPFNITNGNTFQSKIDEIRQKFVNASLKPVRKSNKDNDEEGGRTEVWEDPSYGRHQSLLANSFYSYPLGLYVKKGVSSSGKEALVISHDDYFPLFFFHTVYPLCWMALDEKNKFSISRHPIYPLFHRYMHEPVAIAMTLAAMDKAFGSGSQEWQMAFRYVNDLSQNYSAGLYLYRCGLYTRWKDWRDDNKRCEGKTDTIMEWIDLFSDYGRKIENEQIIELWAKLFDLNTAEVQGLLSAAKYAPVISEGENLEVLVMGLLKYVLKNKKDFQSERIGESDNQLATVVFEMAKNSMTIEEAQWYVPRISSEPVIRDFIGNVLSGWSFSQDLHSGIYRIYGPAVMALMTRQKKENKE